MQMLGVVYRDAEANLVLLMFTEGPPKLRWEKGPLSDENGHYREMPGDKAELVEVDLNEVTGLVNINGLCELALSKDSVGCPAHEAIDFVLANTPEALWKACEEGKLGPARN